jgi:hypothetical protein
MALTIVVLCVASLGFLLAGYSRAAPRLPVPADDEVADYPPVLPPSAAAHLAAIAAKDAARDLRSDWVHTGLRAAD